MTNFTAKDFANDLTKTEQNAITTLIAEGKYARAKTTTKVAASDRDMIITDEEAQRLYDRCDKFIHIGEPLNAVAAGQGRVV